MSNLKLKFQCPSCGSTEGIEKDGYLRCRHCGNRYTKELMDSAAYADLSYAMNERQEADFDKARRRYDAILAKYGEKHPLFHIDIPFTVERQLALLRQAGFSHVRLHWKKDAAAIITARKN